MDTCLATIDAGTTNTRACLWTPSGECAAEAKRAAGVRDTAVDGHNGRLREAVRECLAEAVAKAGTEFGGLRGIFASGMITSNVGLLEVPHLRAPARAEDFAAGVVTAVLPEIAPLPIHFIPGLKNAIPDGTGGVTADNAERMDMMRGEETEAIALLDALPEGRQYLFVLPGSHTKFVAADETGRLTGCLTSLSGEILELLTTRSILADAVEGRFVTEADFRPDAVLRGFRAARRTSLARAAFTARILKQFVTKDVAECANFLLGAVLEGDAAAVRGSDALGFSGNAAAMKSAEVVIAGKEPLAGALAAVFREDGAFAAIRTLAPAKPLAGYGAYLTAMRFLEKSNA